MLFPILIFIHSTAILQLLRCLVGVGAQRELRSWKEGRYLECTFCLDYDDYGKLSLFGCVPGNSAICSGNACYMRQHKMASYFLYTSGCLNLTQAQFENISQSSSAKKADRGGRGTETQLCEISSTINTCICTNRRQCNNVSSLEPFSEHSRAIFASVNFNELAHFRYFLPNDPILKNANHELAGEDRYFVVQDATSSVTRSSAATYPITHHWCGVVIILIAAALTILSFEIHLMP